MSSRLSNLSHELILQIADLLWEEEDFKEDWESFWASSSGLRSSGKQDIVNLSRTSTFFYSIISSYLLRCITLRNSAKSGQAVQYLCSTSQIANITTLHFKDETSARTEGDFHNIESIFPAEVNDILSHLSRFPRLATLTIDLGLEDHEADVHVDLWMDGRNESEKEIEEAEEHIRWRALTKKTLKAISTTCSNSVREFVFKQYPIRTNSVFCSASFNKWLGKLESFRFEPYGGCSYGGRRFHVIPRLHMTPRFHTYINNLDHYFFDAMGNVTRLAIVGDEEGVIGQTFRGASLPLRTTHVPKLKELELGYYSIQDDLLDFLMAHSSTLEHLIFNHGFLYWTERTVCESPGPWKSWFQNYDSKEPRALQCVTFIPCSVPIAPYHCTADLALSTELRQVLEQRKAEKKEHRMFLYGVIRADSGTLGWINDLLTQTVLEEDLAGWYELMAVVNRNRERSKGKWILDARGDVNSVRHE